MMENVGKPQNVVKNKQESRLPVFLRSRILRSLRSQLQDEDKKRALSLAYLKT